MNVEMTQVEVWSAEIDDKPGGLALALNALSDYGADLDCIIAKRESDKPGKALLFVSPLSEREPMENADQAGFQKVNTVPTLRVEGTNAPGLGAKLARVVGDTGVNMHGLSAMSLGNRFVCYLGFDSTTDRDRAETALRSLGGHHDWRFWRHSESARTETGAAR